MSLAKNVHIQRNFIWRISKGFRKVSKREKFLFFGFLEIGSSKKENRWSVHPNVRLRYILTKKRMFHGRLTIHLSLFCDLTLIIANTWWSICSVSLYCFSWSFRHSWGTFIFEYWVPILFTIKSAELSRLFSISE